MQSLRAAVCLHFAIQLYNQAVGINTPLCLTCVLRWVKATKPSYITMPAILLRQPRWPTHLHCVWTSKRLSGWLMIFFQMEKYHIITSVLTVSATPHRTVKIICSTVCQFCMYDEAYRANLMRGFKRSRLNAEVQAGLSWSHGDVFISGDTVVIYNTWMDTWIHNMSLLIHRLQYSKRSFKQLH